MGLPFQRTNEKNGISHRYQHITVDLILMMETHIMTQMDNRMTRSSQKPFGRHIMHLDALRLLMEKTSMLTFFFNILASCLLKVCFTSKDFFLYGKHNSIKKKQRNLHIGYHYVTITLECILLNVHVS